MFRFAYPWFLLLLAVIPASLWFRRKRPMHPAMAVATVAPAAEIAPSVFVRTRWIVPALTHLCLALMIIAMARPQYGTQRISVTTEGINIVLAVDLSDSMAALDFKLGGKIVNRLAAIKSVVSDFIAKRNGDRIGLVVFGSAAYTQMPLTRDYNAIATMLQRLDIGAAGPQTAIGDAIGIAIKRLSDIKSRSNVIILLTDGQSNSGQLDPEVATGIAVEKKVKIYTIGVGTRGQAPFLVHSPLFGDQYVYRPVDIDEAALKDIAQKTGGMYFRAENTAGLNQIYDTIDRMEKTRVKVQSFADYREWYAWLLAPALVLLAAAMVLANTRWLRLP
jgi:Ca-activated chloride channel family protein